MIEITGLYKSFDNKVLLENFSISINSGEFIVFAGGSGCGKSTLLNMIGSIEPVDRGKISIDGMNVADKKIRTKLFREVYGFVFQNFALVENKTVAENLALVHPKYASGLSMDDALSRVGLSGFSKIKVYKLSGGEQQRVALARLMLKKCSTILADEPTGSLDKRNASEVINILKSLRDEGKTLLMVTHNDELKKSGDRVVDLSSW